MPGERLAFAIKNEAKKQSLGPQSVDLLYGEVTKTSPLTIRVDARYDISGDLIELSQMCKEHKITVGGEEVVIWRGLAINDRVKILRVHSGQLFYIMEREGGL